MVGIDDKADTLLTPSEVAKMLRVNRTAVVRWWRRGATIGDGSKVRLKCLRLPGGLRIAKSALDEFLAAVQTGKSTPVPSMAEVPEGK
jgi:hypothetical protein